MYSGDCTFDQLTENVPFSAFLEENSSSISFLKYLSSTVVTRSEYRLCSVPSFADKLGAYIPTHEFAHSLIDMESPLKNYIGMDNRQSAQFQVLPVQKPPP